VLVVGCSDLFPHLDAQREELHGRLAIEAAKAGHIFDDKPWDNNCAIVRNGAALNEVGGAVHRGNESDIESLLLWKQQMERNIQSQCSNPSASKAQDHEDNSGTATVAWNDNAGLAGVTYQNHETATAEASLAPADPSMLKADQYWAYGIITWHLNETLSGSEPPPLRMVIHGEGGTGKSKVIQTITQYFEQKEVAHILLKAAYTGIAASLINGKMTHTIAMVSVGKDKVISNKSKAKLQQFWQHISYLIIDEMSMLAKRFLAILSRNISTAKMVEGQPSKNDSFGRVNVILCGDFHQFPPVATLPTEALYFPSNPQRDSAESQLGRAIYEEFNTVVLLKEQMRVTDPVWRYFLKHLRYGQVKEEHVKMLQTLVITNPDCSATDFKSSPWDTASLVTPWHAVQCLWNEEALHKFSTDTGNAVFSCKAEDTIKGEPLTLRERYAMATRGMSNGEGGKQRQNNQDLPELVDIAVGMRVMVTQNIETDLDITNGARGMIVGIILHPDELALNNGMVQRVELQYLPLCVLVQLDRTRATQLDGLDECVIPVEPRTQTFHVKSTQANGTQVPRTIKRRQFPITAAYAFTDYCSQGQTITHVLIDIAMPLTGGLSLFNLYVALS